MGIRKVLQIEWDAYGNAEMTALFQKRGYEVRKAPFNEHMKGEEKAAALADFSAALESFHPDYVFSWHYFPDISNCCQKTGTPYLAWIYDSPVLGLYSYTVINSVNRIFVFDHGVYEEFQKNRIPTVYYLPLGVSEDLAGASVSGKYSSDITFVGSLYREPKHRLYDRFQGVAPYTLGYLDGIIEAQRLVYGENFLEKLLTPEALEEMEKAYPTDPNARNVMSPAKLYAQFVLSREVTARERADLLKRLGARFGDREIHLYTYDGAAEFPGIRNKGPVEYGMPMRRIFAGSRINLNITLRSILTGIPLRALDILGSGGFLLSNFQSELCEYFVPGEDFDFYEDADDLLRKADYYLSHEKERQEIAENGRRKLFAHHTLSARLEEMEGLL